MVASEKLPGSFSVIHQMRNISYSFLLLMMCRI